MDDFCVLPFVTVRDVKPHPLFNKILTYAVIPLKKCVKTFTKSNHPQRLSATAETDRAVYPVEYTSVTRDEASCSTHSKNGINRIAPEICSFTHANEMVDDTIKILEEAINLHQSDCIVQARGKVQIFYSLIQKIDATKPMFPSKYGWLVIKRGIDIFFDDGVSCSVKHGTVILDAANSGAQFYVTLLNILGAFALEICEFHIAKEAFLKVTELHLKSETTSRLCDLGAAYNNKGCISLIMGDLSQAENDFNNSQKHLNCKKRKQLHSPSVDALIIAVQNNINRLHLMSRNFAEGLEEQEKLVQICKSRPDRLPLQTTFVVMHNQAVIHITLGNFSKAEKELRWMISYCNAMRRDECDFLLNFISLQLCEVLLHQGKPREAEMVFSFETLAATSACELMPNFGGIHFNVKLEAFEKTVDIFIKGGKINFACELLNKGIKIVYDAFGPDHFNVASLLYKQGSILKLKGDAFNSMKKLQCSVEILRGIFGEKHPLLIKYYMSLGDVAFQLKRTDESYLYFQRAMENVEIIHKVSLPDQLSVKYKEITRNGSNRNREQDHRIEGLVAEYGQALAVLSSQVRGNEALQRTRTKTTKGKHPVPGKYEIVPCSESLLISQKCARDLLRSGQALLRQGMAKEATSFFQLASKYYKEHHAAQEILGASPVLKLYTVFSQINLKDKNKEKIDHVFKRCLEDVMTDSGINSGKERSSEVRKELTSDFVLNLKLMLILLILLSVHLKLHDTTFAAYDLYASLSSNDDTILLYLCDGLQIFASRTSFACNGTTAVQDVLVSSATGLLEDDFKFNHPGKPLFRSLAFKKNVPRNSLLATYSASAFLDIDDLKQLERKILLSFEEYLGINCVDHESNATQIVVDLTPTSCVENKILLCSSRIDLLPLCLTEEGATEQLCYDRKKIFEISPGMCENITRTTFSDKPASCFMFSSIGLWLLKQCNSARISTLRVQNNCLVLTVTKPVKARITLLHEEQSIEQKVQVISAATADHAPEEIGLQHASTQFVENPSFCLRAFDRFAAGVVLHRAKTRDMAFETTVDMRQCFHSVEPQIVSSVPYESNGIFLDGLETEQQSPQTFIVEPERDQHLRKCFKVSTLECLTAISEITRQLYGEMVHEDDLLNEPSMAQADHLSNPRDQDIISSSSGQQTTCIQSEQAANSRDFEPLGSDHETDTENQNGSLLRCTTSVVTGQNRVSLGENPTTVETTDDAKVLGKRLFEEDRKSRSSVIVKIQQDIKKKGMSRKANVLDEREGSSCETSQEDKSSLEGHSLDDAQRDDSGNSDSLSYGTKQALNSDERDNDSLSSEVLAVASSDENIQAHGEDRKANVLPTSGEVKKDDLTNCSSAKTETDRTLEPVEIRPEEKQGELTKTEEVNSTPNCNVKIDLLTKATVMSQTKSETQFSDQSQILKNQKRSDLQSVQRITAQGGNLNAMERDIDEEEAGEDCSTEERYAKNDSSSVTPGKERISEASMGETCASLLITTSTSPSRDEGGGNNFTEGGWDQYLTLFSASATDGGLWNDGSGGKETNYSEAVEENVKHHDGQLIPGVKTNFAHSLRGGNVVADGGETLGFFKRNQQIVPDPAVTPSSLFKFNPNERVIGLPGGGAIKSSRSKDDIKRLKTGELHHSGSQMQLEASDEVDGPVNAFRTVLPPDFGGARPKTTRKFDASVIPVSTYQSENTTIGLDPEFLERHSVVSKLHHSYLGLLNSNASASKDFPKEGAYDSHFSATYCSRINNSGSSNIPGKDFLQENNKPTSTCQRSSVNEDFRGGPFTHDYLKPLVNQEKRSLQRDESWHFPPLPVTAESYIPSRQYQATRFCDDENSSQANDPLFNYPESRGAYNEMVLLRNEVNSGNTSCVDSAAGKNQTHLTAATNVPEDPEDSDEDSLLCRLARLKDAMIKHVRLLASSSNIAERLEPEPKPMEKVGIQEQSQVVEENEHSALVSETNSNQQEAILQQNNQDSTDAVEEVQNVPVQETPRPVCSHYQRRCLVSFPCCKKFYPCHRCHNDANDCTEDQARAINATHIRCTICYHEQEIDEGSQTCRGCNSKMSAYFCAICKHFTSVDKNPFHCEKCGICRIHRDKSFHCDVCNVCLDKRLQGKHKCRPDSGHDECCICLEDAFSGCQILPCSHKVHKDCAIAMIQNGVRSCPICRHPLFQQPENTEQ